MSNHSLMPVLNTNDVVMEVDPEVEAIKIRLREIEAEAVKLKAIETDFLASNCGDTTMTIMAMDDDTTLEVDRRSVYVGNVDYGATPEELEAHFHDCGLINRITIICNKHTGHPKGFAYIEFQDVEAIHNALALEGTELRGRAIKVMPKRTNRPGVWATNRGAPSGRGYRGRRGASRSRPWTPFNSYY